MKFKAVFMEKAQLREARLAANAQKIAQGEWRDVTYVNFREFKCNVSFTYRRSEIGVQAAMKLVNAGLDKLREFNPDAFVILTFVKRDFDLGDVIAYATMTVKIDRPLFE